MYYCCCLLSTNTVDCKNNVASLLVRLQQMSVFPFAGKCIDLRDLLMDLYDSNYPQVLQSFNFPILIKKIAKLDRKQLSIYRQDNVNP